MPDPATVVVERVAAAVARLYPDRTDALDTAARPSEHADAQVNVAMGLAKRVGKKPREVAEEIVAELDLRNVCSAVTVAGPGFLNLTYENEYLATLLHDAARDVRLGVHQAATSETVVIDYSADV
jgi:arginyl-tRNA synthetase